MQRVIITDDYAVKCFDSRAIINPHLYLHFQFIIFNFRHQINVQAINISLFEIQSYTVLVIQENLFFSYITVVDHGRNDFLTDYGFQSAGGFQQPLHNAPMTAPQSAINAQMHPYGNWYPAMGQQQQQQAVVPGYGLLPQNLLDQIRYCTATAASPIFILPSGAVSGNQPISNCPSPIYSPSCIPYPVSMPILQSFGENTDFTSIRNNYICQS